jgi:hypothetical protein
MVAFGYSSCEVITYAEEREKDISYVAASKPVTYPRTGSKARESSDATVLFVGGAVMVLGMFSSFVLYSTFMGLTIPIEVSAGFH